MDPNLEKIIESNIKQIQDSELGTAIVQATSYLEFVYYDKDKNQKQKELDAFIEDLKVISNKSKFKKITNSNSKGK